MNRFYKGLSWLGFGFLILLLFTYVFVPFLKMGNFSLTSVIVIFFLSVLILPFLIGLILIILTLPEYADKFGWSKKHLKFLSLTFAIIVLVFGLNQLIFKGNFISLIPLFLISMIFFVSYFNFKRLEK